uniref:Cyclic AMP-dependent transcription factor ATF-6 beta n=1 Tax=Lygus hesperus TaxID=30085 RepID=A0A0A9YNY6_LYGHE
MSVITSMVHGESIRMSANELVENVLDVDDIEDDDNDSDDMNTMPHPSTTSLSILNAAGNGVVPSMEYLFESLTSPVQILHIDENGQVVESLHVNMGALSDDGEQSVTKSPADAVQEVASTVSSDVPAAATTTDVAATDTAATVASDDTEQVETTRVCGTGMV